MQFLFRWYIFYPLAAICAAAAILASLGPALLPTDPRSVSGRMAGEALVLGAGDLAHPAPAPETVHFIQRDSAWRATALRVAVLPNLGPVQPHEAGLQILLAPEAAVNLGSGPFRVEVTTAPVPVTTAPELALGLSRGGETEWRTKPISVVDNVIAFDFPEAPPGALLSAIGIRPVATLPDYNYGVEIRGIRIIPTHSRTG